MARSVMEILSGNADTDVLCTAEELAVLAEHVRQHGAADFLSAGIQVRFPEVYTAAIQSMRSDDIDPTPADERNRGIPS